MPFGVSAGGLVCLVSQNAVHKFVHLAS